MNRTKKTGLIIFCMIVIIAAIITYFIIQINDELNQLVSLPIEDIDVTTIEDGIYLGTYETTILSVIVEVEISNHEILNIVILQHKNGQGESAEMIVESVIENQSIEVDAIAGATYSSKVILLAIKDALSS